MKPIVITILGAAALFLLFSCNNHPDSNDDITRTVNKDGSVETAVQVDHLDSTHDILITTHRVWVRGLEVKTVLYRDTLPFLGAMNSQSGNRGSDSSESKVKKDYEIFITVK